MDVIRHVPAFLAAADHGSFSAAGEALGLTGSAISKSVAVLERDLGVPLLVRSTRGVALTADGVAYAARCRATLSELESAREMLRGRRGAVQGRLRVLMHPMPGRARVAAALPDLLRRHPDLSVQLIFYEGYPGLQSVGADAALLMGDPALQDAVSGPSANLVALPLAHTPEWVCAAPDYLARRGVPDEPEALLRHDCIAIMAPNGRPLADWSFVNGDRRCEVNIRPLVAYNDGPAVRAAAVAGQGLVKLPGLALATHVRAGELRRVLPEWYSAAGDIHLVFSEASRGLPRMRVLVDFLRSLFADLDPARSPHPHRYEHRAMPLHRWKPRDSMAGNTLHREE